MIPMLNMDGAASGGGGIAPPGAKSALATLSDQTPEPTPVTWPAMPATTPTPASAGIAPASPTASVAPAPTPSSDPTAIPPATNLLNGVSANLDPNSPTGGTVTQSGQSTSSNVSTNPVTTQVNATGEQVPLQNPDTLVVAPNQQQADTPAQNWNITPDQTVAGQYAKLMSAGSPAIQAAEEATMRSMAASGGRNNLMANDAAVASGSDVALKMASQDAQINAQAAQSAAMLAQRMEASNASLNASVAGYNAQTQNAFISANNAVQTTSAALQAQYGDQVRLGYLSSISAQQTALQTTMAAIESNPNITGAQAQGAVADAVNQFNTFVSQMGAYAAAMMPSTSNSPSGPSTVYDPTSWPASTYAPTGLAPANANAGGSANNGLFFNQPSTGIAPASIAGASTGAGNGGTRQSSSTGTVADTASGRGMQPYGSGFVGSDGSLYAPSANGGPPTLVASPELLNGASSALSSIISSAKADVSGITTWYSGLNKAEQMGIQAALGMFIPGYSIVKLAIDGVGAVKKFINWLKGRSGTGVQGRSAGGADRQSGQQSPVNQIEPSSPSGGGGSINPTVSVGPIGPGYSQSNPLTQFNESGITSGAGGGGGTPGFLNNYDNSAETQ